MNIRFAALLLLSAVVGRASDPLVSDPQAQKWITELKMSVLPKESGYLSLIKTSAQKFEINGRTQPIQGQVYYMLTRELPTNYLHWLEPDDTHILLDGGPVDYFIFHPDGRVEKVTLGKDVALGQLLVVPVPGGCWKALRLHPGAGYALMANVLSPDWSPEGVRIGEGDAWISKYKGAAPWATEAFLRELIGPNHKP
ncbi:MAG TPA: cupin domain-containing protein [Opitutaceae bacterium]|nr:cupin domain-containing protein [Opitutaceae bacterium]